MEHPKWEGKVSTRLSKATADQIWPLFTDFFNVHKYFPSLETSYGLHGTNGESGGIRYCAGFSIPSTSKSTGSSPDTEAERPVRSWSKERLVTVDHVQRCLSYEMIDSNIGFNSYVSTVKIVPVPTDDNDGQSGCVIEWSFTVDPVEGLVFDDLVNKYDLGLQRMAKRMEDAVLPPSSLISSF
ncbi:lachrymatory-factor synthase [Melia azedarach]|uniref:Lachrymatory-factor synthase n=1 Tax=Melia azedarach TaxID=155640 RepID=A0ACC1XBG6_MELAZ|nr:lachrymatory-factor synthase [Melia azedarach]